MKGKEVKNETENGFTSKGKIYIFRNRYLLLIDALSVWIAYLLSCSVIFDASFAGHFILDHFRLIVLTTGVFCGLLYAAGCYSVMWVYSGTKDYLMLLRVCLIASVSAVLLNYVADYQKCLKIGIVAACLISGFVSGARMAFRALHHMITERSLSYDSKEKRLLIVGAGAAATILLRDIGNNDHLNYRVIGFIDDDPNKKNARINGIKVLGDRRDIPRICDVYKIDDILIALPSASRQDRKGIIEICNETECTVKTLPSIDQIIDRSSLPNQIRKVQIEDLLERDPIQLDNQKISGYIEGGVILVTGGGGSIGSELCRQLMRFHPAKLVIFDIYENNAYELQMELNCMYPDNKPEVVIGSVRDMPRLEDVFEKYRPDIVFHAAAHKHVPLMEDSPGEAVKNNVFGTLNVVKCADRYGVKRFVMISTDKAVNPTNIMGATKRICEMIVQCMQQKSKTEFAVVRFGNVLGSNGSVIPLFKMQIEQGGPVTVTDKRITRFFMTIPEAAQLVLQAASYAKGGEIFVLDMGEPVKIYDLARNLIKLSGYRPDVDIKIDICGLRPGEKLYEELLMDEEGLTNTSHHKIFIGKPIDIQQDQLKRQLDELYQAVSNDDPEQIKDVVAKVVPTYVRNQKESNSEQMVG